MKLFLITTLLLISGETLAFTEVECEAQFAQRSFRVQIDEPIPYNAVYKEARLYVSEEGPEKVYQDRVRTYLSRGFNNVRYQGRDLILDISYWPDQVPRIGKTYQGKFSSHRFGRGPIGPLSCQFPSGL